MSNNEYDANKELSQHKEQLKKDKLKLINQMHENTIKHQKEQRWKFYCKCFNTMFVLGLILYTIYMLMGK